MAEETGQRVGDYEVLAPLGAGGMGRVYKVRNVISNREEAMKILLPDFASDPDLAARFMAEIRTLAGLEHPGIAQLRTAFQINNQFVMVMELVEGTTLEKLAAQAPIPVDQVLDYSTQVLAALSYAHSKGVTHRDIKPANIMITSHGVAKLMDFGIAKSTNDMALTRPGTTMGSVYYMAPEQVRGGTVDARTDIYSFGVTLYEMLTGRKPFQADSSYSVLNAQLNQPPTPLLEVNPAISAQLNAVVLRAMAKLPEERFQTAADFRDALKSTREPQTANIPAGMPVAAPSPFSQPAAPPAAFSPVPQPPGPPPPVRKSNRGLWIGLGAATAILALIAVATVLPRVYAIWASQKAPVTATTDTHATPVPPAGSSEPQPAPASADTSTDARLAAVGQSTPQTGTAGAPATPSAPAPSSIGTTGKPARQPYQASARGSQATTATPAPQPAQPQPGSAVSAPPPGPTAAEIREAHDRYSNLQSRAESAASGVQQIRGQQQAQGLDIRGDILTAMSRMQNALNEANRAIAGRDLETANTYLDRADHEIATLEKFLGR
ncbi:MAG TPA: serine/threonine-protein kinase [Terracidiphilus sp.]|jgi:serine/threonine-protein kinase